MGIIRCPTSQDDMTMNLPMDTNMNRYEKPVQTPVGVAEMAKPDLYILRQRESTTAAEVGRKLCDLTEPSRCQETEVEAEGAVTGAIMSILYRCCDCGIRITPGRNSATDGDEYREPMPIQMCWVEPKKAPLDGTRIAQYWLISQASVGGTEMLRPRSSLYVPVLRMPVVFLKLAEEARNSKVVDDQPTDMMEVQPQ